MDRGLEDPLPVEALPPLAPYRFAHDGIELWHFTPAELTAVGGWESIAVVFERYYGRSADLLDKVYEKTSAAT